MRILVTGGRGFHDKATVYGALNKVHAKHGITLLIQGGQTGADYLGMDWAKDNGVICKTYNAEWHKYGKPAGPMRNQCMIDGGKPDAAVAFPGNDGTADMVCRLKSAGISVWEIAPKP